MSSFRIQMLLGKVPADTVQLILEPLLSNFYELMLRLPPELQADFENILRIYPDVAERFSVSIKPPLVESLLSLSRYRQESGQAIARTGASRGASMRGTLTWPPNLGRLLKSLANLF